MFSKLVLVVRGEEIEFDAHELVTIAFHVTRQLSELNGDEVNLPNYEVMDEELDSVFWEVTEQLAEALGNAYHVFPSEIMQFLKSAYEVPLSILGYRKLLNRIKTQEKIPCFDVQIDKHILIPMQLIRMDSIHQWMFIAKYLSNNYLDHEHLSGWWFEIGGRVVRLRNDVEGGALRRENKQFYASDHGFKADIESNTRNAIRRCISSFTWQDNGGTCFRAFRFWQYFTQVEILHSKNEFVELITDEALNNHKTLNQYETCCGLFNAFMQLKQNASSREPSLPLIEVDFGEEVTVRRERIFLSTFLRLVHKNGPTLIKSTDQDWIKRKFITELTDTMESDEEACDQLLEICFRAYFRPNIISYDELPDNVRKNREKAFDKMAKSLIERHQACLRKEFIAYLNEEIAASPEQCQLLLLSLIHPNRIFRGCIDETRWKNVNISQLGQRHRLGTPEIMNDPNLSEEQRSRYGAIFDHLIEQFRYVTEAILTQRVKFMEKALTPFHTQINQIAHEEVAINYIMTHVLFELAKAINHGKHEPLFRELSAYGDRASGNSYHLFERAIEQYFPERNVLNEAELASQMRAILCGETLNDESLGFLPCLTAAWFISEAARNPLTTMTSLMLLDLIESGITLAADNGDNWYCWRNALIHPTKGTAENRVQDLYGKKMNPDEFGGCHPMAHQGSVAQTSTLPEVPLNVARQKEGHLIIHWLQLRISMLTPEKKLKHGIQEVNAAAQRSKDAQSKPTLDELTERKTQMEKKESKLQGTIRVKKSKDSQADTTKEVKKSEELRKQIDEINESINSIRQKSLIKEDIRTKIIEPLLKLRLSCLQNLLSKRQERLKEIPGLRFQEVPGDGHCFYHAVGLYLGADYASLRNETANYINAHWDEFEETITALYPQQDKDGYLKNLQESSVWADHVEIEALRRALNRPIIILEGEGSIREDGEPERFGGEPVFVYYNGHTHYDVYILTGEFSSNAIMTQLLAGNQEGRRQSIEPLTGSTQAILEEKKDEPEENGIDEETRLAAATQIAVNSAFFSSSRPEGAILERAASLIP